MPEKTKRYHRVKFPQETLEKALAEFVKYTSDGQYKCNLREVELIDGTIWNHDTNEEFFADYNGKIEGCHLTVYSKDSKQKLTLMFLSGLTSHIIVLLDKRDNVESVFNIFEKAVSISLLSKEETEASLRKKLRIFIGHGNSPIWRELNDHLRDKHHFRTEHFEIGATAGLTAQEILREKINKTSFALLVFTADNQDISGDFYPRLNVVHEAGLFQGKLGFRKAIILLEEGCSEFSNIYGLQQLRFSKGNIKETFGDVLAIIEREFGENEDAAEYEGEDEE